mgnify:CR=1 FL=1
MTPGETSTSMEALAETIRRLFAGKRIKRVLLVTPPDADAELFRLDTAKRGRYTNYPPYGLLVLAARLQTQGIEVRVCNLNDEILQQCQCLNDGEELVFDQIWQGKLDTDLAEFRPDLVGITCMFTMTHSSLRDVCHRAATANVPLVIGGVHVSNDVYRVLNDIPTADIAVLREGEIAFGNLVAFVNGETTSDELAQLVVRQDTGYVTADTAATPGEQDINMIPAYDLVDISTYSRAGTVGAFYCFKPEETRFATVLSNRGCRAQCTFCSVRNFNGRGVRQRSIESVADEVETLVNEYGIGHIMWLDDDLLKDHKRAVSLFETLNKRNLDLTWDATNGVIASSCTDEVIHAAAESGCIALNIGMESGNREILKSVRKPGTVETFLSAAEVLRRYPVIHSSVFLMVGFPNETMTMILDTINIAREMDLDWYRISQLHPLPNTPIFDAMVAQGLVQETGSQDLRFNGGAYGKQTEIEQGLRLATPDFAEAFANIPLDAVPTPEQITDIWFFMNYHLNFHRIFHETNPLKIDQLVAHLNVLADVISPENGFALYFLGYLQYRISGEVSSDLIQRLDRRIETSPFWRDRFSAFELSSDDLKDSYFPKSDVLQLMIQDGGENPESRKSGALR